MKNLIAQIVSAIRDAMAAMSTAMVPVMRLCQRTGRWIAEHVPSPMKALSNVGSLFGGGDVLPSPGLTAHLQASQGGNEDPAVAGISDEQVHLAGLVRRAAIQRLECLAAGSSEHARAQDGDLPLTFVTWLDGLPPHELQMVSSMRAKEVMEILPEPGDRVESSVDSMVELRRAEVFQAEKEANILRDMMSGPQQKKSDFVHIRPRDLEMEALHRLATARPTLADRIAERSRATAISMAAVQGAPVPPPHPAHRFH